MGLQSPDNSASNPSSKATFHPEITDRVYRNDEFLYNLPVLNQSNKLDFFQDPINPEGTASFTQLPCHGCAALSIKKNDGSSVNLIDISVDFSDFIENLSAVRQHLAFLLDETDPQFSSSSITKSTLRSLLKLDEFSVEHCSVIRTYKFNSKPSIDGTLSGEIVYWCLDRDTLISLHTRQVEFPVNQILTLVDEVRSNPNHIQEITTTSALLKHITSLLSSNETTLEYFDNKRKTIRNSVRAAKNMTTLQTGEIADISFIASEMASENLQLASSLSKLKLQLSRRNGIYSETIEDIEIDLIGLIKRSKGTVELCNSLLATNDRIAMKNLAQETHNVSMESHSINKLIEALLPTWTALYFGQYLDPHYPAIANIVVITGLATTTYNLIKRYQSSKI